MHKSLVIAEKPSVAGDIVKALGGFKKVEDGRESYFESENMVVTSAVGHLVELCLPNEMDKQKGKWTFASLPVIPAEFALKPIEKTEARFRLLKKLLKRDDLTNLINACDAGREGELIFRYIVKLAGCKKPIQRLWLQSMTPTAIRDGFNKLRPGRDLEPLAAAAVCRSESDWLVGINGTRALTAFNSRNGGFQKTPVGRVQTPTLAIVVERDRKIKDFVAKAYWEVHGTFHATAGEYAGRWIRENFHRHEDKPDDRSERLWTEAEALAIQRKCEGKQGIVTEEKKPSSQLSPLLYDLTTLQREANGKFGLPARRTLQIAQALYEKHKVLTYPRTDSRALPEDYIDTTKQVLRNLQGAELRPHAAKILAEGWVKPTKRVFNNAKVSDHFAIIPTMESPSGLDEMESKIYHLVAKRFLAVFFPAAHFEITTRITRVEQEPFRTDGKVLRDAGWLAIYGQEAQTDEGGDAQPSLIPVKPEEQVATEKVEVKSLETRPPARYNEATLLSSMEGAGKLVEDEELREAMESKGLGTPATRAAIIEGLIAEEYFRRDGRELISTPKAWALMELLEAAKIPALTSPEMTGEWEYKLKQMEQGKLGRAVFMKEIVDLTQNIVERAKTFDEGSFEPKKLNFMSPGGKPMIETLREYKTSDGSIHIRKVLGGRLLEPEEVKELLEKRFIGPLEGFRSKAGWPFTASLRLNDAGETEFVFDNAPVTATGEALDLDHAEPLGQCPICKGRVFETAAAYACENTFTNPATCKMKVSKKILDREIARDQVMKMLSGQPTDELTGFVSNRTKRKFSAQLVMDEEGKAKFKFKDDDGKGGESGGGRKRWVKKPPATNAEVKATMGKAAKEPKTKVAGAKGKVGAKGAAAKKKKS